MRLKPVLFGLIYALSTNAFAQAVPVQANDWKKNFGVPLIDKTYNFTNEIKEYSDIAAMKAIAQLQSIDSFPIGEFYYNYLTAILNLKDLTQDLKTLREKDTTGYFKSLFTDPRFQDFAGSSHFSILDLLKPGGDFLNPAINKDPRAVKLIAQHGTDKENPDLKKAWDSVIQRFASEGTRNTIIQSLSILSSYADAYKISVSIIDPTLAQELIDYASYVDKNKTVAITQETALKDIPFPSTAARLNSRYVNNFAELASGLVSTTIKRGLLKADLKIEDLNLFIKNNPKFTASLKLILKNKDKNSTGSPEEILTYLNGIKRPSGFAFDQFIVAKQWGVGTEKEFQVQLDAEPTIDTTRNQMAAIDGLARTLVGEAMSCQSAGSNQFEAIGLVFAERAKSIADYYEMDKRTHDNDNDTAFFQKQKEIFYSASINDQFYRYLSNNLRGALDFGRRDTPGKSLHEISQALSAPLQFDSWQAVRSEKKSLRSLIPQISKNIPELNLDFYLPQTTQEAAVFNTVLRPLDRIQNQEMFNKALEVAAQVVLHPDEYRKRYQFVDAKGAAFNEVYFYTHGVNLSFAIRVPTVKLKDTKTGHLLPLIPPTTVGACGKVMFFKATPQNSYRLPATK